jgi:hypothetical protein
MSDFRSIDLLPWTSALPAEIWRLVRHDSVVVEPIQRTACGQEGFPKMERQRGVQIEGLGRAVGDGKAHGDALAVPKQPEADGVWHRIDVRFDLRRSKRVQVALGLEQIGKGDGHG